MILGNPGGTHSVPTACSGYGMDRAWVTEDGENDVCESSGIPHYEASKDHSFR